MKKLFIAAIAVFGVMSANAQDATIKAGINLGLPMGDIKKGTVINLGADFNYLWEVADGFRAGAGVGFTTYLPKEQEFQFPSFNPTTGAVTTTTQKVKGDAISFLPIYGTAEYSFTENIFGGLDLGYAVGVAPSGIESGLLYQPKIGYSAEKYDITIGYKGISLDGGSATSINLGFAYKF